MTLTGRLYVFFTGLRFSEQRRKMEMTLDMTITPNTLRETMHISEDAWKVTIDFANRVIKVLR